MNKFKGRVVMGRGTLVLIVLPIGPIIPTPLPPIYARTTRLSYGYAQHLPF